MRHGSRAARRRVALLSLTAAASIGAFGLGAAPARAQQVIDYGYFRPNGSCLAGTWTVPHGVTEIDVQAIGQAGGDGDGYEITDVYGNQIGFNDGGAGGHASEVDTRIHVTPGETLYVGVANTSGPNAIPGGPGASADQGTAGGAGGAASWVANVAPIETRNGGCNLGGGPSNWLVIAAGGGGGGGAASRFSSNGGDGGTEALGGNGSEGNSFPNSGGGGSYWTGTVSNGFVVGSGGGGGSHGYIYNCTSGADGGNGDLLGDPQHFDSPPASVGGGAGAFDKLTSYTNIGIGLVGIPDCSQPPKSLGALDLPPSIGGGGGGGGGGLYSGGGGGGSDDSGEAGGGGGASGTSYAQSPVSYSEVWTWDYPKVDIEAVTTAPSVTSPDRATFVTGVPASFTATATGVDTPYVDFRDDSGALENNGLVLASATFPDGAGAGWATLSGTPIRSGVTNTLVDACNGVACTEQGFQLTVDQPPGFASSSNVLFAQGQQNTFTVRTSGFPAPSISASNAPAWLTVTDNGNGTATLSGTPPAGTSPNTYTVDLTASNVIGATAQPASAQQTLTFTIVKSLAISPASTQHLAPGFTTAETLASSFLYLYQEGWQQQYTVTGTRPDGTTFDATGLAVWSSSNPATLTVSSGGLASATHKAGTSTVTAGTYGTLASSANVVVAAPQSITVTPGAPSLIPGQKVQFTATGCYGRPCSSNSYDITTHVGWSSASNFVTVDANGLGTAGTYGNDTVLAELYTSAAPGEVVGSANPSVSHGSATSIDVTPTQTKVVENGTAFYTATVHFQDGTFDSSNPNVRWSAQDVTGTNVATITNPYGGTGRFYGFHAGTATVTASYTSPGGGTVSASAALSVIAVPTSLTISGCSDPIVKATTCQLTALARYGDGSTIDVTNGVTWSSDPSVLRVSSSGLLTATGTQEGATANVSASLSYVGPNGPETIVSNHLFPTVTLQHPVSLAITPTSVPTLHPGGQTQFTATATYGDGSTENVTNQPWLHWFYDNSIATGFGGGLLQITNVLQRVQGTVHVYAWDPADGIHAEVDSNTVPVTVTDPLDHVAINADGTYTPTIVAGQLVEGLHVEGYDSRGVDLGDVTADSTFSVSPDGTCSGLPVICLVTTAGNHTITASDPNAATPLSTNSLQLAVSHAPASRIVVTGGSHNVFSGLDTAAYHVTAYDPYGNATDVTNQSTFCIFPKGNVLGCSGPPEHVNVNGRDFYSGCDYPSSAPTCHAPVAGDHTVEVGYAGFRVDLPLSVDPSLVLTQLTLGGGPTGDVAVGAATTAYTTDIVDFFGNAGAGQNVALSITPDGTCDNQTGTCTAASTGTHTVTAEGIASDGSVLVSNALTFDAVDPDHLTVNGNSVVGFGRTTDPYTVEAYASGGADLGDVTADTTLSISPDGSCDSTAHTCTPGAGDSNGSSHTITATYTDPSDAASATGSTSLTVTGVESIALIGDTTPIRAGESTHPMRVEGYSGPNQTGTDLGDVTADTTLSISPDGTCDNAAHTCTATVADTSGSHTITATFNGAGNPTSTLQIEVDPSPVVASAEILGGSSSIAAGDSTAAYEVDGLDRYGNDVGNLTAFSSLSISPSQAGSSCNPVTRTCTATDAGADTVTAHLGGGISATTSLTVAPGAIASLDVSGGSDSVQVGDATAPYTVEAVDAYGNHIGDVTAGATLSISPDGTCDDTLHTCTGTQPDLYVDANLNSRHTVTASYGGADGTATVFVTPNLPPFATNAPYLDDMAQQYNQSGDFTLDWGATQDPEHDPLTYSVQQKSAAAGSSWQTVDGGLTCSSSCQYTFGGANPAAPQGAWTYRIVASDGYSSVPSSASTPVYVDNTAPTTTDDVPSGGWVTTSPFDVTLSADDGATGSGIYDTYYLVGNAGDTPPDPAVTPYTPYNPPFNQPQLGNGQVVFYYSVDNAGNQEPVQTSAPASVDAIPPATSDDVPTTWTNQDVTTHLYPSDNESGVAATYYTVGTPGTITDPTTSSLRYDPANPPVLTNGEEIKYFSVDNAGNAEPIETSHVAEVDTTPPATTDDVPLTDWTPNTSITVTLNATDSGGSGVAATYYATGTNLDPSTFWSDPSRAVYTGPVTLDYGQSIEYASVDGAGNEEQVELAPTPSSQTITFSTDAPTHAVVGDVYVPTATATPSGLPVGFLAVAPPGAACIYVPGTGVKMIATGTCTVTATQPGDNFWAPAQQTQTFTVGPKTLTVTGITAANKVYDGTTTATIDTGGAVLNGVVGNDKVTLDTASATGAFIDPSPGSGKIVQISGLTLSGAKAANYVLAQPTARADITATAATAPLDLVAERGVRSLTLDWTPPASAGGDPIESYLLTATHGSQTISKTLAASTVCAAASCSYTLSGLANGTAYDIEISAETAAGQGAMASASGTTDDVPGAPRAFTSVAGSGRASLEWEAPASDGGAPVVRYRLTVLVGKRVKETRYFSARACKTERCSTTVTGLRNGTRYVLRLTAINAVGESGAASASVKPAAKKRRR